MDILEGRFAGIQDQGDRDYQEDDYGVLDGLDLTSDGSEHTLLVLADGMGGHVGGAAASDIVVNSFVKSYQNLEGPISDRLRELVNIANEDIARYVEQNTDLEGMGATVVAAAISKRGIEWVSMGDSPMWLFRKGELARLNADHSMVPVFHELIEMGRMTQEEADSDPKRHTLRSALTGDEIDLIDVSSQPADIRTTDILILASDGIETLSDNEIAETLDQSSTKPLKEQAEALVRAIKLKAKNDQDNITILLYQAGKNYGISSEGATVTSNQDNNKETTGSFKWLPWVVTGVLLASLVTAAVLKKEVLEEMFQTVFKTEEELDPEIPSDDTSDFGTDDKTEEELDPEIPSDDTSDSGTDDKTEEKIDPETPSDDTSDSGTDDKTEEKTDPETPSDDSSDSGTDDKTEEKTDPETPSDDTSDSGTDENIEKETEPEKPQDDKSDSDTKEGKVEEDNAEQKQRSTKEP